MNYNKRSNKLTNNVNNISNVQMCDCEIYQATNNGTM